MKIAIGNDHAAPELKNVIKAHLESKGIEVIDFGVAVGEKADYPIQAEKVALAVVNGEADLGIAICGSGIGISIACNKVKGIRAACCSDPYSAKLSRIHNNSNILCFGARVVGDEVAKMMVDEWLNAKFEGGRHQRRIDLIKDIEDRQ
ncbi:MAG: ribose 5-phosphate isomerase B [Lachnospiraceae bacterium]|nr:ribose 5-phosphate isomerase B [Lachnospiraceae bacterium]